MHTIETRYPDGTRARYTLAPGSTVPLQLAALKPLRTRWARSEKRLFPEWYRRMSTADYVRQYFELNSQQHKLPAYPSHVDHLALYAPLPDRPAAIYTGVDSVEVDE
jgi:hypothetical protein